MPKLSIVIAALNEPQATLHTTLATIWDTTGSDKPEVLLIDDCSSTPLSHFVNVPGVTVIKNERRCGCGPSRTIGALCAKGDYLLFCDPHMVFTPGWFAAAMSRIEGRPRTLFCSTCFDSRKPESEYLAGATLNVFGPDRNKGGHNQVFQVVWEKGEKPDDAEIPAVMGAQYFWPRDWFLELNPLANLRYWGCDEEMMSVKAWLSGGEIRLMRNVKIGHRFTWEREKSPFSLAPGITTFNRLLCIHTLCPEKLARTLAEKLKATVPPKEWFAAVQIFNENYATVALEKARNQHLFVRRFEEFCEQWGIVLP